MTVLCLQTNDAFVAPLLRLNHCHLGEAEKMLKKYEKNSELIILYQRKGLHKKALELLHKQSTQQESSLQGHERTVLYLQHLGEFKYIIENIFSSSLMLFLTCLCVSVLQGKIIWSLYFNLLAGY